MSIRIMFFFHFVFKGMQEAFEGDVCIEWLAESVSGLAE